MNCPYCISAIDDAALACPHCTRDLYLFKPLLARIQSLESALADAAARIGSLEARPMVAPAGEANAAVVQQQDAAAALVLPMFPTWLLLAIPLALLLIAHFIVVVVLDSNELWLRLASLAIPLPFGFLLLRGSQGGAWARPLLMSAGVSALAVLGMNIALGLSFNSALLPVSAHDWRETGFYAASIFLSFVTGMVVSSHRGRQTLAQLQKHALVLRMVGAVWGAARDPAKLQKQIDAMHSLFTTLAATGTAVASVGSCLLSVFGK